MNKSKSELLAHQEWQKWWEMMSPEVREWVLMAYATGRADESAYLLSQVPAAEQGGKWPKWLEDDIDRVSDAQLGQLARLDIELQIRRRQLDEARRVEIAQRKEIWAMLSWWTRLKIRAGLQRHPFAQP